MKPQYEGRSPGRIWYAWQRTKALASTFRNSATKSEAKGMGRNTAISAGSLLTAGYIYANITLMGLPTVLLIAGVAAGGFFGIKAFNDIRSLRKSSACVNYIREQENKWVVKQSKPKLMSRIKAAFTRAGTVLGCALAAAGTALATTAILQYTGVILPTTLASVFGPVAATIGFNILLGFSLGTIPLGIVGAIVCHKATRRLLGKKEPEKKSFFYKAPSAQNDNKSTVKNQQSVTNTFSQSATVKKETALSEERLKAAEARKAGRKKDGPKF
jgi:hypothetical protein